MVAADPPEAPPPPASPSNMARSARHYAPILIGLVVFLLVVTLTPSVLPQVAASGSGASGFADPLDLLPPALRPGASGVARSGVHCAPDVRQVPWSHYAPICQPRYTLGNGGSTARGVTARTITVTFRYAATSAEQYLLDTVAPSTIGTEAQGLATAQAYIKVFNKEFELYGRQVVLKEFQGQGDILNEASGGGQEQAQADAATARTDGAFADVSFLFNTPVYNNALFHQGIVAVGGDLEAASEYQADAPYGFTPGPDCNKAALASVQVIGRAMAGLPAIYSGTPADKRTIRTFGFIEPETPLYQACTSFVTTTLEREYGVNFKVVFKYSLDLGAATGTGQYQTAIDKLKAEGVTSVLCACDPITPIYLTQDANQQDYHPEWFALSFGDAFSRLPQVNQWSHAISGGTGPSPQKQQEAYRVYRMVYPHGTIDPAYESIYEPLLLLFDSLQAAGPHLTPTTFEHGLWSLPDSVPGGEFGIWQFGRGTVDPDASFQMLWYDPTAVSEADGKQGAWLVCNHGAIYTLQSNSANLPLHKQLQCGPTRRSG